MSKKTAVFGSKSAFVRSCDTGMPAKEIQKLAKAQGMKLSVGQIYNIRSVSKKAGSNGKASSPRRLPAREWPSKATPAQSSGTPSRQKDPQFDAEFDSFDESTLRRIIAEVGTSRTRAVLAEVEQLFS